MQSPADDALHVPKHLVSWHDCQPLVSKVFMQHLGNKLLWLEAVGPKGLTTAEKLQAAAGCQVY